MYRILFCCFLFVGFLEAHGEETGSLIVTYQTGPEAERLDRVRFWLKDAHQKLHFYPKENGFVEDAEDNIRMVVIENLEPGTYSIEFLVPNHDNRFEEVPIRTVEVIAGGAARLDQRIKMNYLNMD